MLDVGPAFVLPWQPGPWSREQDLLCAAAVWAIDRPWALVAMAAVQVGLVVLAIYGVAGLVRRRRGGT